MASKKPVEITGMKLGEAGGAAETAEAEAIGRQIVFQMPLGDGETLELVLPKRWKRFKFMRRMSQGDLWGAIETVGFSEEQLERLEDADVTEEEFEAAIRRLGETLTGKSQDSKESST